MNNIAYIYSTTTGSTTTYYAPVILYGYMLTVFAGTLAVGFLYRRFKD